VQAKGVMQKEREAQRVSRYEKEARRAERYFCLRHFAARWFSADANRRLYAPRSSRRGSGGVMRYAGGRRDGRRLPPQSAAASLPPRGSRDAEHIVAAHTRYARPLLMLLPATAARAAAHSRRRFLLSA